MASQNVGGKVDGPSACVLADALSRQEVAEDPEIRCCGSCCRASDRCCIWDDRALTDEGHIAGGMMGLPDLDSLIRAAPSAVVLVLNDACYGAEIHQYGPQGLDEKIMDIDQADFSKLAQGFGAVGAVARPWKTWMSSSNG